MHHVDGFTGLHFKKDCSAPWEPRAVLGDHAGALTEKRCRLPASGKTLQKRGGSTIQRVTSAIPKWCSQRESYFSKRLERKRRFFLAVWSQFPLLWHWVCFLSSLPNGSSARGPAAVGGGSIHPCPRHLPISSVTSEVCKEVPLATQAKQPVVTEKTPRPHGPHLRAFTSECAGKCWGHL